jgi:hypothetical protein
MGRKQDNFDNQSPFGLRGHIKNCGADTREFEIKQFAKHARAAHARAAD